MTKAHTVSKIKCKVTETKIKVETENLKNKSQFKILKKTLIVYK